MTNTNSALATTVTASLVTERQISTLRIEAAQAGDTLQIVLCDIALERVVDDDTLGSVRAELEEMGIYPEHIGAEVFARQICAEAIESAAAQKTPSDWRP